MPRFGFVTCVQLGLSCMESIYEIGGRLDLAMTLHDDLGRAKSGRVKLDAFCNRHSIPLVKVSNINDDDAIAAIRGAALDWLFIIGWSQIAREKVLGAPARGVLGMHPTLLPEGRGRAAVPWAILKRLARTGVTMFQLDSGIDTGGIVDQIEIPLTPQTDATELYAAVDRAHAELMKAVFPRLQAGEVNFLPQDETRASEWAARKPEDGIIDLAGSSAEAECLVRAVTRPYPGAFVQLEGRKIVVWKARLLAPGEPASNLTLDFADGRLLCTDWEDCGPWNPSNRPSS